MQITRRKREASLLVSLLALASFASVEPAQAWTYKTLHSFRATDKGGYSPSGGLLREPATGSLYGVTTYGGDERCSCGVVFRLAEDGTYTVLHTFGGDEGAYPLGPLAEDAAGNLYGTTAKIGVSAAGAVFKLAPDGTYTLLHAFAGGADGENPQARLTWDESSGNLYGVAGVAFKVNAKGKYSILYPFDSYPNALILGRRGNLYGTTHFGGDPDCNCGQIFSLTPHGTRTVLYNFTQQQAAFPSSPLALDKHGNLYGAGYGKYTHHTRSGSVFRLGRDGAFKVLYWFEGTDLGNPEGEIVVNSSGAVFGVTRDGDNKDQAGGIFQVSADGTERTLHISDYKTGSPSGGLIADEAENLYGVTGGGGNNSEGTVFELVKD